MGLRLFFLPNFPEATFIQGAMFFPDSRVVPFKVSNTLAQQSRTMDETYKVENILKGSLDSNPITFSENSNYGPERLLEV